MERDRQCFLAFKSEQYFERIAPDSAEHGIIVAQYVLKLLLLCVRFRGQATWRGLDGAALHGPS